VSGLPWIKLVGFSGLNFNESLGEDMHLKNGFYFIRVIEKFKGNLFHGGNRKWQSWTVTLLSHFKFLV